MELSFSTKKIRYLQTLMHEVKHQEETAEAIIPDTYPDAASVADSYACAFLRSRESRNGSAIVSGAVKAGVIYNPEDGTAPRHLEYYIPFAVKFDSADLTEDAQIHAVVRTCSVDARLVNSRKVVVRVNVGCCATAFKETCCEHAVLDSKYDCLACKTEQFTICMPVEAAEKAIAMSDSLELNSSIAPVTHICKGACHADLTDRKLIGDKAVFKGNLHVKLLYQSENGRFYTLHHMIPFSQYIELGREYDEDNIRVKVVPTSFEVDSSSPDRVLFNAELSVQCTVWSNIELTTIEDAYCIGGELSAKWADNAFYGHIDHKSSHETAEMILQGTLDDILDTDVYIDFPVWNRSEEHASASIPVFIKVSGYNSNGAYQSLCGKTEITAEYPLSENSHCMMEAVHASNGNVRGAGNGVDIRYPVDIHTDFIAPISIRNLISGEMDRKEGRNETASVIVRAFPQDTPLWNIGKQYCTSVSTIKSVNKLENDSTCGGMLLIPVR